MLEYNIICEGGRREILEILASENDEVSYNVMYHNR